MTLLFRGMLKNAANHQPQTGNASGNTLGVRPADVVTYLNNDVPWVAPLNNGLPQGMSVTPNNGCDLPIHRRPKNSNWNGTGSANLVVWRIDSAALGANLQYLADPNNNKHGFVAPAVAVALATYQNNVQATAPSWVEVAPPAQPCQNASSRVAGANVMVSPSLKKEIADAVAVQSPTDLVKRILDENRKGVPEHEIVSAIEAEIVPLEAASRDDEVEMLRSVLDRIAGFCGEHLKLTLR